MTGVPVLIMSDSHLFNIVPERWRVPVNAGQKLHILGGSELRTRTDVFYSEAASSGGLLTLRGEGTFTALCGLSSLDGGSRGCSRRGKGGVRLL